jgi:hypothetical protein
LRVFGEEETVAKLPVPKTGVDGDILPEFEIGERTCESAREFKSSLTETRVEMSGIGEPILNWNVDSGITSGGDWTREIPFPFFGEGESKSLILFMGDTSNKNPLIGEFS